MKTFKSFVTKRILSEEIEISRRELFQRILTTALSNGPLTEESIMRYLDKKGDSKKYAGYSYLVGALEDSGFDTNVDFLNRIFIPYFASTFKDVNVKIDIKKQDTPTDKDIKTVFSKINTKWKLIYDKAVKLNSEYPDAGYIVPEEDFTSAAIKLLEAKDVESPEVQFFVPHRI